MPLLHARSYSFNLPAGRQVWQMQPLIHPQHVQKDFLKYTAQRIKHDLQKNHPELLTHFESDANDRTYHPDSYRDWKRRALSIELRTDKVYLQKLIYIHSNPAKQVFVNFRKNTTILQPCFIIQELIILRQALDGFLSHHRD